MHHHAELIIGERERSHAIVELQKQIQVVGSKFGNHFKRKKQS